MCEIKGLDLKGFVGNAMTEVFDMMVSMELEQCSVDQVDAAHDSQIVGSVSFAGEVKGSINIHLSEGFAKVVTAAMLEMEPEEIEGKDEIYDVIGELSNMVGGDLKSRLVDSGFSCALSIPTIIRGNDFKIESIGSNSIMHERLAFRNQENVTLVELLIKTAN